VITEFNYRYADKAQAHVFVGIHLSNGVKEKIHLLARLADKGYAAIDMTDNEMAKSHIRHMVGGHTPYILNEHLYRFEFPERPGALLHFLTRLGQRWNISLFHYRNHGAAYGRVLVGIQVPPEQQTDFQNFLDQLGFPYWLETDNPAYHLFLK